MVQVQSLQDEIKEIQQLLNTREKEIESLTVCRGQLDDKIVSMSTEMKEKEEYHEIQVTFYIQFHCFHYTIGSISSAHTFVHLFIPLFFHSTVYLLILIMIRLVVYNTIWNRFNPT